MPSDEIKQAIDAWLDAEAKCEFAANEASDSWQREHKAKEMKADCEHTLRLLAKVDHNTPAKSYLIQGQSAIISVGANHVGITPIEG